ncbi:MAG TPA: hypothetical protein VHO66_08265 [Ruminiclostridium sp.]|nr:hypothetical protein [Ruminiclostridium sp.]
MFNDLFSPLNGNAMDNEQIYSPQHDDLPSSHFNAENGFYSGTDANLDNIFDTPFTGHESVGHENFSHTYVDNDGNGIIDTVNYPGESGYEHIGVSHSLHETLWDNSHSLHEINSVTPNDAQAGLTGTDLPNYNPQSGDSVIGNPSDDMQYWHMQSYDNTCAINAQMFALDDLTGQHFDENQLRNVAEEHGWYSENGGTPIDDMGNLLQAYGLHTVTDDSGSMNDITNCLEHGGKVIAAVDGDEIWYGNNDSVFSPGEPNHAVEVIGIDNSNPDQPMVILNDSGTPDGQGEMVPVDQFMDAWKDSGCAMVEAYQ